MTFGGFALKLPAPLTKLNPKPKGTKTMQKTKWTYNNLGKRLATVSLGSDGLATVESDDSSFDIHSAAQLIAAAPEMLEALKVLTAYAYKQGGIGGPALRAMEKAKFLIAKIENR